MKRLIALFALVALTSACPKSADRSASAPPPPTPQLDEKEPDNDPKTAQGITDSVDVKGSFTAGARPDEDWYRIESGGPTMVRLDFSGVAGSEATLEVLDADHNRLLRTKGGAGEAISLPDVYCKGLCFVRLIAAKKDAAGPYTLKVKMTSPTPRSEREPNDRYVDAQPITVGSSIDGYLAPAEDEDWYLVVPTGLPPGQMLSVSVASPTNARLELSVVRQSDQAPLGVYRASDTGEDLKLPDLALPVAPETGYYLVLRSAYVATPGGHTKRLSDAKSAYTLEVKAVPALPNVEIEPNEDATHATLIDPVKLTRQGFIAPKGDTDWYTFRTAGPCIVRAEVSGVEDVKLALSIIDPAKKNDEKDNELAKTDSGDVKEPQVLAGVAVPAGDNYVKVEGAYKKLDKKWVRDYANPTAPYTLTISVDPDDGTWEREPNDKPANATPVEVGKEYKGYIQPAGDVDYWKLDLKDPTNVAISVSAVPKLDLKITVLDATKQGADGKPSIVGMIDKNHVEAEERLVVPFEPGSYLIEISEKGKESNAQKPYILSLK